MPPAQKPESLDWPNVISGPANRQPLNIKTKESLKELDASSVPLIDQTFPVQLVWRNILLFIYLHGAALYGLYLLLTGHIMIQTAIFGYLLYALSALGITAGSHRLWSHKSYKANFPLRVFLAIFQTMAFQNSIFEWSRDHRVHHKYSETNADPHNAKRGFFFAHMGWLLSRKHPSIREKGQGIDLIDLENDGVVVFQKKYYLPLVILICFVLPTIIPMYLWGESLLSAWFFAAQFRYCFLLNSTWLVNSAAHLWGPRPYDKSINPAQNKTVAIFTLGEGWHNYHHTFPWDYKTAELGKYQYNWTSAFIDTMAKIGWAYDLKTVPRNIVLQRVQRSGDGSHESHDHIHAGPWGWGDKEIPFEDSEVTETLYRSTK